MSSIGEILRTTRISKNITLSQVKKATHVREHVLIALENDDLRIFHSQAQLRGFIMHYCEFLGIDHEALIAEYLFQKDPAISEINPETPEEIENNAAASGTLTEQTESIEEDYRQIYVQLAHLFAERRKALNLSLDEVEHYSHVRKRNITLIESGDFDAFGSTVQLKGLLSTYTDFLELDREKVLTLFAEALLAKRQSQSAPTKASVNAASPFEPPLWARQLFSMDLLFGLIVLFFLLVLALWGGSTIINNSSAKATENPSISEVLLNQPTAQDLNDFIVTSAPGEATSNAIVVDENTATPIPTTENLSPVNVTIIVLEKALLRVTVDGKVELNTRTIPGSVLEFHGKDSIEVLTGSGSSVKLVYNQQDLGTLGQFGEAVSKIFGAKTEITATPSITPTPTVTLRPTRTQIPTATAVP